MNFFNTIGNFFVNVWNAYFDFMVKVFTRDVAVGITIVIGFALASIIFIAVIRKLND